MDNSNINPDINDDLLKQSTERYRLQKWLDDLPAKKEFLVIALYKEDDAEVVDLHCTDTLNTPELIWLMALAQKSLLEG